MFLIPEVPAGSAGWRKSSAFPVEEPGSAGAVPPGQALSCPGEGGKEVVPVPHRNLAQDSQIHTEPLNILRGPTRTIESLSEENGPCRD